MGRIAVVVIGALAACAQAPDGLLIITGEPGDALDLEQAATVDVFVGVDRGVTAIPLTGTRPFVVNALPDDLDRTWEDPSQAYKILLDPYEPEVYVVLRGQQVGRRFGANLAAPVSYPGDGLVSVIAGLYRGGDHGVCPHGTAEDAGYVVEILPTDPGAAPFDCDQDGVVYGQDCTDYDETLRPSPDYPPTGGLTLPDEMMCCNLDQRAPALAFADRSGTGSCNLGFGCPDAPAFLSPREVDWTIPAGLGGGDLCACLDNGQNALDCIAGAKAARFGPVEHAPQPYCDLAVEEDGTLCPDQVVSIRDRIRDFLPANPAECPLSIWFQAGPVAIEFRGQGAVNGTSSTDDCDADIVFGPVGPPPGPIEPGAAIGWYIIEVSEPGDPTSTRLAPMHVHANPEPGCDRPMTCGFE